MDINMIGMILSIFILIVIFIQILRSRKQIYQKSATDEQMLYIFNNTNETTEQCTYSIWFYVNDWANNYGEEKCIFRCSSNADDAGDLNVYLGTTTNDLTIQIKTTGEEKYNENYKGYYATTGPENDCDVGQLSDTITSCNKTFTSGEPTSNYDSFVQGECNKMNYCNAYSYYIPTGDTPIKENPTINPSFHSGIQSDNAKNTFAYQLFTTRQSPITITTTSGYGSKSTGKYTNCVIEDVELQKWINLVFSINTNSIDVYINGEMIKSQILNGIASISNSNKVFISPNGKGFNGWNSKFEYWTHYMNPREVKKIYNQGNGSSNTKDLRLNISLYKGDERRANLVI
jgi:hypothetical protein